MIPWVREKFAERRARWVASRKQRQQLQQHIQEAADAAKSDTSVFLGTTSLGGDVKFSISGKSGRRLAGHDSSVSSISIKQSCDLSNQNLDTFVVHLNIVMPDGKVEKCTFSLTETALQVKLHALSRLHDTKNDLSTRHKLTDSSESTVENVDVTEMANQYKLIRPKWPEQELNETVTVEILKLANNDELLLLPIPDTISDSNGVMLTPPTQKDIDEATAGMAHVGTPSQGIMNINDLVLQSDIQYDIRRILIALSKSAAYVLGIGPYAQRLIAMLKQRLIRKRRHEADTIQCLVDMGFSRSKAIYALRLKNDVYSAALEWLIENQSPMNLELTESGSSALTNLSDIDNVTNTREHIEALLEIIRIYSQRDFPPTLEQIQSMVEMGFDESMIREALKVAHNNQTAACEWLVGNREKVCNIDENYQMESLDQISFQSTTLKTLMASPHIQLSLSNPKLFIAYLSIIEDYSSMNMWLSDIETAGIIGQILRTYHDEKHILAINQFKTSV